MKKWQESRIIRLQEENGKNNQKIGQEIDWQTIKEESENRFKMC